MTVSVAMCTYNGARYLRAQLDSIAAQTRPPDELVVCDDRSCDETVTVLRAFAEVSPFPVRVCVNAHNLGSTKNFEQAIGLCTGDIIALCDQDDVWHPEKLARQEAVFTASPQVGLVFSDAEVVDEDLQPMTGHLWDYIHFTPEKQQWFRSGKALDVQMAHSVVTGATMAFRTDLRRVALPIPDDIMLIHDGWIALIAAAVSEVTFITNPLIRYRQHPEQQVGIAASLAVDKLAVRPRSHYETHLRQLKAIHERLASMTEQSVLGIRPSLLRRLHTQIGHLQSRLNLPPKKPSRLPITVRELLTRRYHRYSNGFYSFVRDLFY